MILINYTQFLVVMLFDQVLLDIWLKGERRLTSGCGDDMRKLVITHLRTLNHIWKATVGITSLIIIVKIIIGRSIEHRNAFVYDEPAQVIDFRYIEPRSRNHLKFNQEQTQYTVNDLNQARY